MQTQCFLLLFSTILLCVFFNGNPVEAGCAELRRCCPGKTSACKYKYGNEERFTRACYCDEFCLKSGDCCDDYKDHCMNKAQDCVMTYWSHWSHCSARCGQGMTERRRRIHVAPSNGGKPCGPRRQTRGCYHNNRRCRNSEIAQLLPAQLNRKRNAKDKYARPSVRKIMEKRRSSYCINYRISSLSWYCRYVSPYHVLKAGSMICAECHDTAMDQEGHCQGANMGMLSRWRAMTGNSCYGSWESKGEVIEDCRCGETPGKDFIFV